MSVSNNALDCGDMRFVDVGVGFIEPQRFVRYTRLVRISATVLFHKADGAVGDRPSLCFLCESVGGMVNVVGKPAYFHEISLASLSAALARAGYELKKRDS